MFMSTSFVFDFVNIAGKLSGKESRHVSKKFLLRKFNGDINFPVNDKHLPQWNKTLLISMQIALGDATLTFTLCKNRF